MTNRPINLQLQDYRWEKDHPIPVLQVELRDDNKVVWVNFNGVCVFRACNLPEGSTVEMNNQSLPPDKQGVKWKYVSS